VDTSERRVDAFEVVYFFAVQVFEDLIALVHRAGILDDAFGRALILEVGGDTANPILQIAPLCFQDADQLGHVVMGLHVRSLLAVTDRPSRRD
jgi:hypothetical protein